MSIAEILEQAKKTIEQFSGDTQWKDPVIKPQEEVGDKKNTSRRTTFKNKFVPICGPNREYKSYTNNNIVRFFLKDILLSAGYDIVLAEFKYRGCWADLFSVVGNRAIEFEIKSSRQDYFNDFKKTMYAGAFVNKHSYISSGKSVISRFYFVVPEGMVDIEECPYHTGLIYYTALDIPVFRIVKHAPLLSKEFLPGGTWSTIAKRLMVRNQNLCIRYQDTEYINLKKKAYVTVHNENSNDNTPDERKEHPER